VIYREQKHPAATFLRCDGCANEPKHVLANGRLSREPVRIGAVSERHMIECTRCGCRTKLHDTLDAAVVEWGANHAQAVLPLRLVKAKVAAA